MEKQKITIIALAVALFLVLQYVLFDQIQESRNQEKMESFQQGYTQGLTDAVTEIFIQTEDCLVSSITIGNYTRNIVDYSCLSNNIEKSKP